ncbi:uncharacterized protein LOC9635584 [Selaginella moellendorffii]|uniref:uncharacterized protein LOC9635584 n=1 Tax=Selaginella moellendorffii TaxID=88036 RepID=UPI000D1C3587|nr:uncharacterized protein LOC9635584 [Selaginella moellendorffii]|eukprot:XP_024542857.1 uncharacterized protein LOC9635584 [Selaginella moellendorffii]
MAERLELGEAAPNFEVMFICNHCPYVVHLKEAIAKLAQEYSQDGPQMMAEDAKKFGYNFPYLYDETQQVAKAYGAVCTPEFFLFKKVTCDIREALDCVLSGKPISGTQFARK